MKLADVIALKRVPLHLDSPQPPRVIASLTLPPSIATKLPFTSTSSQSRIDLTVSRSMLRKIHMSLIEE